MPLVAWHKSSQAASLQCRMYRLLCRVPPSSTAKLCPCNVHVPLSRIPQRCIPAVCIPVDIEKAASVPCARNSVLDVVNVCAMYCPSPLMSVAQHTQRVLQTREV